MKQIYLKRYYVFYLSISHTKDRNKSSVQIVQSLEAKQISNYGIEGYMYY